MKEKREISSSASSSLRRLPTKEQDLFVLGFLPTKTKWYALISLPFLFPLSIPFFIFFFNFSLFFWFKRMTRLRNRNASLLFFSFFLLVFLNLKLWFDACCYVYSSDRNSMGRGVLAFWVENFYAIWSIFCSMREMEWDWGILAWKSSNLLWATPEEMLRSVAENLEVNKIWCWDWIWCTVTGSILRSRSSRTMKLSCGKRLKQVVGNGSTLVRGSFLAIFMVRNAFLRGECSGSDRYSGGR